MKIAFIPLSLKISMPSNILVITLNSPPYTKLFGATTLNALEVTDDQFEISKLTLTF